MNLRGSTREKRLVARIENNVFSVENTAYDYENGTLYFSADANLEAGIWEFLKEKGVSKATIASAEDAKLIASSFDSYSQYYVSEITVDEDGNAHYPNGEKVEIMGTYTSCTPGIYRDYYFHTSKIYSNARDTYNIKKALYEVNIPIYVQDIKLRKYLIDLDLESQYQLQTEIVPRNAQPSNLVFESEDENVATVDENGLVTPVSIGSTKIKVSAPDYALYTYATINIRNVVLPRKVEINSENLTIQVGESEWLDVELSLLPELDRQLLEEGIPARDDAELQSLLEDLRE